MCVPRLFGGEHEGGEKKGWGGRKKQGEMLTQLVRTTLNETAISAPYGFSASDGQTSVNAVRFGCSF